MSAEKIILDWKKGHFKPVYWLEGEESFFIDQVMDFAEKRILSEAESGFNLSIFYGRDADWASVVNACRRYPMFSERQVVLLKEAQHMRDIDRLEGYVDNPLTSTILVVGYKEKKVDGRSKLAKILKSKGEMLTTKKMYDNQLPDWVMGLVKSKGYDITQKATMLLVDHIGSDLSRLNNEVEKVTINLTNRKQITEDDIEEYVGISKEYNPFELQAALMHRNLTRALTIIQYFQSNPKAAPVQLLLPTLYSFFSKVYLVFGMQTNNESEIAKALGVNPFFVKDYLTAARNYRQKGVETALLLLHEYNLKSIGIGTEGIRIEDASLLKEMIVKMIL